MTEYIDRKQAIEAIMRQDNMQRELLESIGMLIAARAVANVPLADVAPVVHGKWVKETSTVDNATFHGHRCSVCGWWKGMEIFNYCPNCGARMVVA